MSKAYRRSLLVFYLERPPKTGDRGKDFRTLPGGKPPLYNPVLDTLIRDIRGRQSIIRSLLEDAEAEKLPFIGSATTNIPVLALAERIVRQIDFDLAKFRQQDSVEDAFAYLRYRVEDQASLSYSSEILAAITPISLSIRFVASRWRTRLHQ